MKKLYYPLVSALLLLAGTATAQTPVTSPLQPVQTIALGPTAALGGTVRLPNHNTVLLLTDSELATLQVQCLGPDGRTLWNTTVHRFQHPKATTFGFFGRVTISNPEPRTPEEISINTQQRNTSLLPINVFTDGNNVLLVERIYASAVKELPKDSPFEADQVYVQRIDAQGHATNASFAPLPKPVPLPYQADAVFGRYADAQGYVEIVRATAYSKNKKERFETYSLLHYDLGATTVRREPLVLPPTTWLTGSFDMFRFWYQDWAYLGHRPNQTYFCRRILVNSAQERAGQQPLTYQVYVVDDQGNVAPSGFSTTLGLARGTTPSYSGDVPNYGELDYALKSFRAPAPASGYETYAIDLWGTTGVGSFYLDHGTGDVLIFGEYGEGDLPSAELRPDLLGYFEQRFTADGKRLAQLQTKYSDGLRAHKKAGSFTGQYGRRLHFHLDPLTQQSQYGFSPMHVLGQGEDFDLFLNRDLNVQRVEYLPGSDRSDYRYTTVVFSMPFWLYKDTGTTTERRHYIHAAPDDLPVYAALEKLSASPQPQAFHEFHLSATGPSTGVVIERKQAMGGSLEVYTF